ncbi:phosphoribosylanthranilate isomerase [Gilvimarinus agarilyticus]|uniref:phosphoribosylanthranilate isomerase n=1 Tax=Gilvimarinus sp. 2_MG-2023 TaxID=3062666 RepID=UPI001C08B7A8|nr:phosphoribosylanthranilate isomerase [Gilvimarinus sp. 2_MG-2023]MBU2885084.1 phosphoribosylanthranilate isomerase [Gilvimarinus agarilyticus]MDO6569981.1 phosphoribosylanthranilate isomerase [Gilvimarinus sp. 2_MG-2023]
MRVKICGITTEQQARQVVAAGADAVGLVFYPKSPRAVTPEQARAIALACGPFVTVTGLFVNAGNDFIASVLSQVPLQLLQFHGDETAAECESFQRPYMKALRMRPDLDLEANIQAYTGASGILLDAYRPDVPGGTGETFDWQRVPKRSASPIVLAGGLTPENVGAAVAATGCYAVDVSGGVEASAGVKDPERVKNFIVNAKAAIYK